MISHPYTKLNRAAYWRSAVGEQNGAPDASYCQVKWPILRSDRIATAGSCFAQHIGRHLKAAGYTIIDAEPPPTLLPPHAHNSHGYGIYSARYGNIYTARQLLQLVEEAFGCREMSEEVWQSEDGRFVDALATIR